MTITDYRIPPDDLIAYRILAGIDVEPPTNYLGHRDWAWNDYWRELNDAWMHASFAMALQEGRPWAKKWFKENSKGST